MKCLLVDDEPGIREGLAMLLRRRGCEVQTAGDCKDAEHMLAAFDFDVVVTDWRLPDGTAERFAATCCCPVVAVSGHPEEVVGVGAIREVLAKPVHPTALLELLDALAKSVQPVNNPLKMATDVRLVVEDAIAQLPQGTPIDCVDDGTFVVLKATLASDVVPSVRNLGGDLRVLDAGHGCRELELRLCRDGRPDLDTVLVAHDAKWPDAPSIAVECSGIAAEAVLAETLEQARLQRLGAGRVCLVNVPEKFESWIQDWETTHDMPMREKVGPMLSAEQAELWR
ncbi:MAG: response regulator [Planctomycetota bacterium]